MRVTLPDAVCDLYRRGLLPAIFRVADVYRYLQGQFAENYIRTALANYAVGGNYAKNGSKPRFRRVARGIYELV